MRIAIFPNHGGKYIPAFLKEDELNFPYDRIKMAEIIDALHPTHDKITQQIYDSFDRQEIKMQYIKGIEAPNIIFVKDTTKKYGYVYAISIEDVDTSNLWTISEYDGAEYIEYFKMPEILDAELGFAR